MSHNLEQAVTDLRGFLLNMEPRAFEVLVRDLLSCLFAEVFRSAGGGNQRGGDGGTLVDDHRKLIFEARRYGDQSRLDARSIRGQIDQAVERNPALEAWILVTTREVPEQIMYEMAAAGRPRGIETLVIDWATNPLPRLAALCASAPKVVETAIGESSDSVLSTLQASFQYKETIDAILDPLRRGIVGYELLRQASHSRVCDIWTDTSKSLAFFGQDVAGGAEGSGHIGRTDSTTSMDEWHESTRNEQPRPAIVEGREGMGKTWSVIDWMQARLERLPILILAPAKSIVKPLFGTFDLVELIARYLRDIDNKVERDQAFWERRVRRVLDRPVDEGPALLLFFDGLNERPSDNWRSAFDQLQVEPFVHRVLVVATARSSFIADRMNDFLGTVTAAKRIEVGPYDIAKGGEFERRLAIEGLTRTDLPTPLVELARVPRLFRLAIMLSDRLGGISNVTVHRLLWEYGEIAMAEFGFEKSRWRNFLAEMASEFLHARRSHSAKKVAEFSGDQATPKDIVYQRISAMVDGVFAQLSEFGEVQYTPEFVQHSLGLLLVRLLIEKGPTESKETLERFFQPMNDHDEEAEIVRAAVSIGLQSQLRGNSALLSALCTHWVGCHNLPESHMDELSALAPELLEPLLHTIEQCNGHTAFSARYRVVTAVSGIDPTDRAIARTIASRGARWLRRISLNERNDHLRKLLKSRIGINGTGRRKVLGLEFEIVSVADEGLSIAAAQLLQGRTLVEAADLFYAEAVRFAITNVPCNAHGWLNTTNTVDPIETAVCLRKKSESLMQITPEHGVHKDLSARAAAILLWRTGYEEDAINARLLNPRLDNVPSYDEEYLSDPASSLFRLERRHVEETLIRQHLSLQWRTQRSAKFLVDPNLRIPETLRHELIAAARSLDFKRMAVGLSTTQEDWRWRDLSVLLARSAPCELARLERHLLRGFRKRTNQESLWAAIKRVPELIPLVRQQEKAALGEMRRQLPDDSDDYKSPAIQNCLVAEIQGSNPNEQLERILEADIDYVSTPLAEACKSPSPAELDNLIEKYRSNPQLIGLIAGVIGEKEIALSETTLDAFFRLLREQPVGVSLEPVWIALGLRAPERLGNYLDKSEWSWGAENSYLENHMGSIGIAAANRHARFETFAYRLAPARLLATLSQRTCSAEDIAFAVTLLNKVILERPQELPAETLEVSHHGATADKSKVNLGPYQDVEASDAIGGSWGQLSGQSGEKHESLLEALAEKYAEKVEAVRHSREHFHLEMIKPEHFDAIIRLCPDAVESWLAGIEEKSHEFIQRIHLDYGFYVPLCEALLAQMPDFGLALWRAFRECLPYLKFTVNGSLDRLVWALFAGAPTTELDEALGELYSVESTRSDRELVQLVVAARRFDRLEWLKKMVARDALSSCPLNRRRAAFLEPLLQVPEMAPATDWPGGKAELSVREKSWILGQREAFAHHWLQGFAEADTAEQAYACWKLFLACVDCRACAWLWDVLDRHMRGSEELRSLKLRYVADQMGQLGRAIEKNEKHWSDTFAHDRYSKELRPWNE